MSDCSSEAMKPKMPPKTCERPGMYRRRAEGTTPEDTAAPNRPYVSESRTCDACSERIMEDGCKVKARCYDLGQRCQQLEQVSKELFDAYRRLLACYRGAVGLFNARDNATPAGKFRERLESLGVIVDD